MATAVFLEGFRDLADFLRDDIAPDLAVFRRHLGQDRPIGINRVAVVDEKVRVAQAHRFIDFHAAKIGIDAPALTALVAAPVKPHGTGAIGRRCGPELARDGFALDLRIIGIDIAHAHEDRLADRQAAQVDTGREIGRIAGRGADNAADIVEALAGIVFDDHLRSAVAAAPDDRPLIGDVTELYPRRHLRPFVVTDADCRMAAAAAAPEQQGAAQCRTAYQCPALGQESATRMR